MTRTLSFVLGTRPEIIKLAPVIRACDHSGCDYTIVHTGQHYSDCLDDVFFDALELPRPNCNLAVGSGSHGAQTGEMIREIESVLLEDDPDVVIVQGDTNSALAGGLVASKLDASLAHVEAGLRSFDEDMPEEINRRLIDHASDWLFAPTSDAAAQLKTEAIPDDRIAVTGNPIVDAVEENTTLARRKSSILADLEIVEDEFALLTAHRAGNVSNEERFASLLEGVDRYAQRTDSKVVYPIHPRSAENLESFGLTIPDTIQLIEPLDFLDFLQLEAAAAVVFTDSGGVQEETCILGTPCVTLRENTERPETLDVGSNVLAGTDAFEICTAGLDMAGRTGEWPVPFGDGNAARAILDHLGVEVGQEAPQATI